MSAGTHRRGKAIRHPIVAAIYDRLCEAGERRGLAEYRRRLAGLASGEVLEIGGGTGRNLAHYPSRVSRLTVLEPDLHMYRRALPRLRRSPVPVRLIEGVAEALPFRAARFDTVIATLVFCTVADPARAAREIARVLKPGGRFLFLEHVRAETPGRARLQDLLTPLQRRLAAGCHPNRDTVGTLCEAGFRFVGLEPFEFGPPWVKPHVLGSAVLGQGS